MATDFSFEQFDSSPKVEVVTPTVEVKKDKPTAKKINFEQMPDNSAQLLEVKAQQQMVEKYTAEQAVAIPLENGGNNSHLSLILSPNLRELELMIRGLEYVKRYNPLMGKEEILLRKIEGHPLNEYGINIIMSELKVYASPEIKLGRKRLRDYYLSLQHVARSIVRLIYKNLRNFGMDTQVKQRNAKRFCNAIIEFVDASLSRSIEGKENDLSRPTEFQVQGNMDGNYNPSGMFNKQQKEQMKN